jgi:hypothetical protein
MMVMVVVVVPIGTIVPSARSESVRRPPRLCGQ